MINLRLTNIGKITIDENQIYIEGFDCDGKGTCRETGILALIWAIGKLQKELTENIAIPGGTGNVGVD